jgi:hypothetical protein
MIGGTDGEGKVGATPGATGATTADLLRAIRFVLVFALIAFFAWHYWLPATHRYFNYETRSHGANWDFRVYYAAGHNWALGLDPYRSEHLNPTIVTAEQPIRFVHQATIRFIYLPTLLPAYRWLAHLPYLTARRVWVYLNFAVLAAAGIVAVVLERGRRLEVSATLLLLAVVSFPLLYHIREGNIDMIVAGLATCGFLLYGRYRSWPSAILLALAVVTKVTPLLVVATLVVYHRDLRFLAKSLAAIGVMVGLSLLYVPLRFYGEAAQVLFLRSRSMIGYVNQSAMRWLFYVPWGARIAGIAAVAGLLALVGVLGERRRAQSGSAVPLGEAPDVRVFFLAVLVMLLFSPIAWVWTYVWVLVPAAMLLSGRQRLRGVVAPAMLAVAVALMSLPIARRPWLDSLTMIGGGVALACTVLVCLGVIGSAKSLPQATPGSVVAIGPARVVRRRAA